MKNNNLIQILKTFDAKEIKELGEFVRSEFFNRNQNVIKLYSYLAKCHPDYAAKKVSKEEILKRYSPAQSIMIASLEK